MKRLLILMALGSIAAAQCTTGNSGTNCMGPLTIQPGMSNGTQTAIILGDLGLPSVAPASKQYILSIASGVLQESDNGGAYHSLVGPPGPAGQALKVGTVLTVDLVCPKGKGTVSGGFTSKSCTATITAIH